MQHGWRPLHSTMALEQWDLQVARSFPDGSGQKGGMDNIRHIMTQHLICCSGPSFRTCTCSTVRTLDVNSAWHLVAP